MESFDRYAGDYDELLRDPLRDHFADGSEYFIRLKCEHVERRLARRGGRRPLRVLDAGCGRGTALGLFGRDIRVFGSDVSQSMLRDAARRGPVTVQEPLRLPFADGTFDAVFAFCIYHHIPDVDHVTHLSELRRVVAEGGEVMVFEHNPYNPVTARIFARGVVDRGCHMIRPRDLRATFAAAGFETIEQAYVLFVPERLSRRFGFLEHALGWLPVGGQYLVAGTKTTHAGSTRP